MSTFRKRPPRKRAEAPKNHPGRTSFVAFIQHVRPDLTITPQIELLAHLVEGPLLHGDGWLRLILVWPPGTGKTWAGYLLVAWIFGLHPSWHVLTLCLAAPLAKDIGSWIRDVIYSKEFNEVFPDVSISKSSKAKEHFNVVDRQAVARGEFNAAGRSTKFTGRRGKLLHFDDLIAEKEADQAVAIRDAKNTISAAYSRGHPEGYHWLINNTRYREDDPIGHILDKYKHEGPWKVVKLTAEAEHEQKFENGWVRPKGHVLPFYTAENLRRKKLTYTEDGRLHEWFGQFCGEPRPPTGRKLDGNDISFFDEPIATVRQRADRVVVVVDTARKAEEQNDPSAITVMGQQGQRHNVLHCEAERWPFLDLCVKLAKVCLEWRPSLVLVEDSANGTALYETLTRQGFAVDMSSGRPVHVPFHVPIELVPCSGNVGSKVMRFDAAVPPAVRQGWLWLPRTAPWKEELVEELVNFPRVAHDDRSDTLAIWFKWAAEHGVPTGQIEVPRAVTAAAAVPGRAPQRNEWQSIGSSRRW